MRKIIEIVAGYNIDLSDHVNLEKHKIKRLWTVYDEQRMWNSCKFNPHTGKKVETLEDLYLQQHQGIFLEDQIHDWKIRKGRLDYYSRVVAQGDTIKILIEYEEKDTNVYKRMDKK